MIKKKSELVNKNVKEWFRSLTALHIEKKTIKKPLPMISISRQMGSGGRPIAQRLVKKLGKPWVFWHKQLLDEIAKSANVHMDLVSEIDESVMSTVTIWIKEVFGERYLPLTSYQYYLVEIIRLISKKGYAVIVGRGANFLLPHALSVRLTASYKQRVAWEIEFEKISKEGAQRRIWRSDYNRKQFIKQLYNADIDDCALYDLTIATDKLGIDEAVKVIITAARAKFGKNLK